jgi:hypothetical protein
VRPQELAELPGRYAVCRLQPGEPVPPAPASAAALWAVARTRAELSVVCPEEDVPPGARVEAGWAALELAGPFALEGEVGILSSVLDPLAAAGISIFALSTFDTDYVLVHAGALAAAAGALRAAGHAVILQEA